MTQLPHGQSGSVNTESPLDDNRQRTGPAHAAGRPADRPPPSASDFGEPTITRHNSVDAPPPNSPGGQRFGAAPPSTLPPARRTVHRSPARTPPPRRPASLPRRVPRALRRYRPAHRHRPRPRAARAREPAARAEPGCKYATSTRGRC